MLSTTARTISKKQVRHALDHAPPTPQKRSGRPPILDAEQRQQQLVDYVCQNKENRRKTWHELAHEFSYWGCGWIAIKHALEKEGFNMRTAMCKPPISEKNRKLRLKFAMEHKGWTYHEWCKFLWSDETWITHGRHMKQHVLRRPNEEWHEDCIEEKIQRKKGWMWWGCFHGDIKGPGFFWEKDWGTIGTKTYCERTVPVVAQYLCDIEGLKGMVHEMLFM